MKCRYACGSQDHLVHRRTFLGGMLGGFGAAAVGMSAAGQASLAGQLHSQQKRILVFFLAGGVSQLETWDPKPGTDTGGPFRAIPTSVPGTHICELLPHSARQMHRLSLVRSINTRENNHGKGKYLMERGRREEATTTYPHLGAVSAKMLAPEDSPLPGYIQIMPKGRGGDKNVSAYLGVKYGSMVLADGAPPKDIVRPGEITDAGDQRRNAFRKAASQRFLTRRRTAATEAYTYSYEQAARLMARQEVFDVTKEPAKDQERYGGYDFGRHCLLARRLLEHDVSFVQVTHTNYDTHHENFDFHIEQLGEFDHPFATLVADLDDRGLLDSTLVVVMAEFGRTPKINTRYGRDHWGTAWSIALGGAGIQPGAVIGSTNANGTAVADRQVDHGNLFHTYLQAVGVDSTQPIDVDGRPMPLANPASAPIKELLA